MQAHPPLEALTVSISNAVRGEGSKALMICDIRSAYLHAPPPPPPQDAGVGAEMP